MQKTMKVLKLVVGIVAIIFLAGSFPVKYYFGQDCCDRMRMIGFVLWFVYLGTLIWMRRNSTKNQ